MTIDCSRVPFTYTWIEESLVLIGSIPQQADDTDTLRTMGIQAILSLTRRDIRTYEGVDIRPFHTLHIPIADNGIASDDDMLLAVDYANYAHAHTFPLYVHCRGGIGRSGIILQAYYTLHRGMTISQARDMLRPRRNYQGNACAADQSSPQREWLERITLENG